MNFNVIKRFIWDKRYYIVISALVLVFIISITCCCAKSAKSTKEKVNYYDKYYVNKNGYTLVSDVVKAKGDYYVFFTVEDDNGNKLVDTLDDEKVWELKDIKQINFAKSSLDIVVSTKKSDEVVYLYKNNGEWVLQ